MRDIKIKDVPLVESLTGQEKIPVSDGSGSPKAISVLLILDKTPAPDLSGYVTENDLNKLLSVSKYEFVDLGLPSGLKWATCNVGAENPWDYGMYFAWGEPDGYYVTDESGSLVIKDKDGNDTNAKSSGFKWADYKLCNGSFTSMTKYCKNSSYGTVDNKTVLEQVDDVAYVSDNTCRMPTKAEIDELRTGTTSAWTTDYNGSGVSGMIFTSKADNSKSIFVPAAGDVDSGSLYDVGSSGRLWSSSLYELSYSNNAWGLNFYSYGVNSYNSSRYLGFSVRPVQEANVTSSFDPTNYYTKEEIDSKGYLTEIPEATVDTLGGVKKVLVYSIAEDSDIVAVVAAYNNLISKLTESGLLLLNLGEPKKYLTIEALEDGLTASLSMNACEYCVDEDGDWKTLSDDTPTESINAGQTLSFRGNLTPANDDDLGIYGIGTFTISKKCNILGNATSMLFGDDAQSNFSLGGKDFAFCGLFAGCTNIISARDLYLPATTATKGCYSGMFNGCTSLTTVPELPATTLAEGCYNSMFAYCTSLTQAPAILPATTLADYCYQHMFDGCTSLTTAPELPATTLASNCYANMFYGCTGLTTAPELPATMLAEYCYSVMFKDCTSLTTAPTILPATVLADYCYQNMFAYCTSLTTAPELPATVLAESCYSGMFAECVSLTTAPELPATVLVKSCYHEMFIGCTSLTTAPELPAIELAHSCYSCMFRGCTSLTTAPELSVTTWLTPYCYQYMFDGCTSLTTAPALPATKLTTCCYSNMFNGCTSLNYIKMLATDISANTCLDNWVDGVASTGTFIKHPDMTSLPTGTNGIPSGWIVETVTE